MVVRDRGARRILALVTGLSPGSRTWMAEDSTKPERSERPALRLAQAVKLIGG